MFYRRRKLDIIEETKWDFYSIVEADKTTMEKLVENVRAGAEFTAVVGGVALAVVGLATGGTAYLIAGVVVESAALIDYLLKNEPRTVEIFICSKKEIVTKRFKKYRAIPE